MPQQYVPAIQPPRHEAPAPQAQKPEPQYAVPVQPAPAAQPTATYAQQQPAMSYGEGFTQVQPQREHRYETLNFGEDYDISDEDDDDEPTGFFKKRKKK